MTSNSRKEFATAVAYLHEIRLVIEVFSGKMSLEAMKAFKLDQSENPEFNSEYNVLTIQNSILIDGLLTEVEDYVTFLAKQKTIAGNRKVVTVFETPNQAIYSSVFKKMHDKLPQEFTLRQNMDDALTYLNLVSHKDKIESKIKDLIKKPTAMW